MMDQNLGEVVNRSIGVYYIIKDLFLAFFFVAVIVILFLIGIPWYFVLIFAIIAGTITTLSIRRSLKAARGQAPPPQTVVSYKKGEGFKTKRRYSF